MANNQQYRTHLPVGSSTNPVESVHTQRASIKDNLLQARAEGVITVLGPGEGVENIVDPANTTTPLSDALAAAETAGRGSEIYLPPETMSEDASPHMRPGVAIYGMPGQTVIDATTGNNGLVFDASATATGGQTYIYNPVIAGVTFEASSAAAWLFGDNGPRAGQFPWVRLRTDSANPALDVPSTAAAFENVFGLLRVDPRSDAPGAIRWQGGGAMNEFGMIVSYPSDDGVNDAHIITDDGTGGITAGFIHTMNLGGAVASAVRGSIQPSGLTVGRVNWEPNVQNTTPDRILYGATGPFKVGGCKIDGTCDYVYNHFSGSDHFGHANVASGGTINFTKARATNDDGSPIIWEGFSSQATNDTATAGIIACLADLTTV